jgi:hypothetical protein
MRKQCRLAISSHSLKANGGWRVNHGTVQTIATSVVGAIAPQVELAEIERARRKPTASLDAYDRYLRGFANLHRGNRESVQDALPMFHNSIDLDPKFAAAHAMAAWCYFWRKSTAGRSTARRKQPTTPDWRAMR